MNARRKYFYLWSILAILLFACKKESDKLSPVILISLPLQNQTFQVDDAILIQGNVSDESALTNVSVTLLNDRGLPVHRTVPIDVISNDIVINTNYLLDNIHLETGIYQLRIFASDGKNDANTDIPVYITGVPRVLKNVFVATSSGSSPTAISTVDSTSASLIPYISFSGDHLELSINSYFQKLFHCGKATGNFEGLNLINRQIFMNIPGISSSSQPYFTGFYTKNNQNYISNYNEQIRGYDHTGNIIYNAATLSGYVTKHFCINDQHLIAEEQDKINKDQKLVCYYPTGIPEQSCTLTQEVVAFCEKDDAHVMVFGNKAGQGLIQEYDRLANNLWTPYPFALSYDTLLCVLQVDVTTYLLAFSNGNIYKYQYALGSVTAYLNGYTAIQLVLDGLTNTLYVVEKNKINTFDYTHSKLLKTINSTENILKIGLLYNR